MENEGYEEIGRAIAGVIVQGGKSKKWALEMLEPLGYTCEDLDEWLRLYRREHYDEIRCSKRKELRRQRRIARYKEAADEILRST
ncbi:MAG: hypothetical protein ACO4AV_13875 [bacterium]|jgi:hypothetical protein